MTYTVDRTAQLENALARNRFGSVASLRNSGVTARQHNENVTKGAAKKSAAKKTAAKKTSPKPVKKSAAKKTTAKKAAKTAKKSTATKKS